MQRRQACVEFSIDSRMPLTSVRIAGSRFSRFGGARALAVGDLDRLLRRSRTRGVRYAVDLENGVEHHLIFEAEAEDSSGRLHRSQAYVRVNADSDASIYKDGDRIKITKLGENGRPSEEFVVRGEWTHPDSEVLVSFSTEACKILEVNGIVKVQLEPAGK